MKENEGTQKRTKDHLEERNTREKRIIIEISNDKI